MSWLTRAAANPAVLSRAGRVLTALLLGALTTAGLLPAECGEPLLAGLLKLFAS